MQTTKIIERTDLKSNPFSVPHGYFDLLPQQIDQKIVKGTHRIPFTRTVRFQLAYAASIILFLGLGYGLLHLITSDRSDVDFPYSENISLFKAYTLLQNDDAEEPYDSEQIITFLTEHGISPNAIALLE